MTVCCCVDNIDGELFPCANLATHRLGIMKDCGCPNRVVEACAVHASPGADRCGRCQVPVLLTEAVAA